MRLGQLARKLSLRPIQIVEFLAQQNIQIEDKSNIRMEDNHVILVVQKFAPASLESIVTEADEIDNDIVENEMEPQPAQSETEENIPAVEIDNLQPVSEPEVIRVPKIELTGLKVVGKIELPEPKKKDEVSEQTASESGSEKTLKSRKPKTNPAKQKRSPEKPWKNPMELHREREAREAEDKRRAAIERDKEKRKKYYEQNVKSKIQSKRVKPVKDQSEKIPKPVVESEPGSWLVRFWRWLTYSDKQY